MTQRESDSSIVKYVWVVDADIEKFFDSINHDMLVSMLETRIDDRACIRLIQKWLSAGVLKADNTVEYPGSGTPQGGIVSPVLANIYLHFALDRWFESDVKKKSGGETDAADCGKLQTMVHDAPEQAHGVDNGNGQSQTQGLEKLFRRRG